MPSVPLIRDYTWNFLSPDLAQQAGLSLQELQQFSSPAASGHRMRSYSAAAVARFPGLSESATTLVVPVPSTSDTTWRATAAMIRLSSSA